jgi:hypothetical protein
LQKKGLKMIPKRQGVPIYHCLAGKPRPRHSLLRMASLTAHRDLSQIIARNRSQDKQLRELKTRHLVLCQQAASHDFL